jgi:UDP-N-acetylglucosamine 2-epimerase
VVDNLKREGINNEVYLTGDVMLDSFLQFSQVAERNSKILHELGLGKGEYLLATVHQARNTEMEENLENIVAAFCGTDEKIVFPIHPRTVKYLKQYGLYGQLRDTASVILISPVGYLDSIILIRNAKKILTDSGGFQKEAYFSKVPCITLDEATGWPETVENGWNILVGSEKDKITEAVKRFEPKGKQRDVFGDGRAGVKIAAIIAKG